MDMHQYKILLVEDDLVDQMAFKRMLRREKLSYKYDIAGSLQDAKDHLTNNKYDLVITDYQLGDGNAVALFEFLETTPFLFATGGGDEEIAVKALKAGAYDYLIKDQERNYLKVLPLTIENAINRSKMNERLRLLESVVVNANDAVVIASTQLNDKPQIMYVNEAFTEMSDYQPEDIFGQSMNIFQGEETDPNEARKINLAFDNSEAVKSELILYKKDGTPYWAGLSIVPLVDNNGQTTHFVSIQRDITARKKAEQDLIEAKEAAEQAKLAEQQFLANMSHDIRTPMNAVIGMTHLLLDSNPSPKQKEYLDALKFSADSLMGIISDILDISKIEAGKLDFEQKQFNLHELVLYLQQTFQFKLKEKNLEVVVELDEAIENDVIGDPTRLNQILTNLLGNAGKFTDEGQIGVKLKVLSTTDEYYNLQFEVFDTGIGIEADKLDVVFENFKQANNQIHRKFGGTGLGLSIVKSLVSLQGGKIWVESIFGEGASFIFQLPLKNSGIKSSESNHQEDSMGNQIVDPNATLVGAKVLIAEDNTMNQKLISEIMNKWSCDFEIADDGLKALEKLNNKAYDIVLMDVNMPNMNGYTAAEQLRGDANNINQNVPIIALTAAALQSEREKVFASGMNEFISKPFVPANLKRIMLSLMSGKERVEGTTAPVQEETVPQAVSTASSVAVDLTSLRSFSGGDSAFITEMVNMFLQQMPSEIALLETYLNEKSWDKLGKLAHKMKPNYDMMGMKDQRDISKSIEIMGKSGEVDESQIIAWANQLVTDTKQAFPLLEGELASLN